MIKRTICIENACFLKFSNEQMVVSYGHIKGMEDKPDKTVPIEDLGILVLEHQQITLTHYLLDKLVSANVAVITAVPGPTVVTTPASLTVATAGLEEVNTK